jgi:CheY-like chemotaxis protein
VIEADSVISAIAMIESNEFDLIVCDFMMPNATGIEVFKYLETHPEVNSQFIMFSAAVSALTESQRETMIAIEKSDFDELIATVACVGGKAERVENVQRADLFFPSFNSDRK